MLDDGKIGLKSLQKCEQSKTRAWCPVVTGTTGGETANPSQNERAFRALSPASQAGKALIAGIVLLGACVSTVSLAESVSNDAKEIAQAQNGLKPLPKGSRVSGPVKRNVDGKIAAADAQLNMPTCDLSSLHAFVDKVPAGTWQQLPGTAMRNILLSKSDAAKFYGIWGSRGSAGVLSAWNSAAFDGCNMYFMGGGHKAYGGNEIYRFNIEDRRWTRLTDPTPYLPSSPSNRCPGISDTSKPVSSHTYDGIVFSPLTGTIFIWAAAPYCDVNDTFAGVFEKNPETGRHQLWEFDPTTLQWTWHHNPPEPFFYPITAADPATGAIVYCRARKCGVFDPTSMTYSPQIKEARTPGRLGWGTGTFDPKRRRMIVATQNRFLAVAVNDYDIGNIEMVRESLNLGDLNKFGIAYDSQRDVFGLWDGNRNVHILDPEGWKIYRDKSAGASAPLSKTDGVYDRWVYLPGADAFLGIDNADQNVWVYRLAHTKTAEVADPKIRTCGKDGECSDYPTLQAAITNSSAGATITLPAGTYRQAAEIRVPGITLRGEIDSNGARAHLTGVAFKHKAALVISAPGVTIENIECSQIAVGDGNGACVRLQSSDTTLRNVYFHDNQQGILGGEGGTVRVENSVFERNGHGGRAHGIYISDRVDELVFIDNKVLSTRGQGHGVKSRAARTEIRGNVIAGLAGHDSRAIDVPNGGEVVITGNVLEKGPNSDNNDMIGIAREHRKGLHAKNSTLIENNYLIFDTPGRGVVLTTNSPGPIMLRNNVIVGTRKTGLSGKNQSGNRIFPSRGPAGLEPSPTLPDGPPNG